MKRGIMRFFYLLFIFILLGGPAVMSSAAQIESDESHQSDWIELEPEAMEIEDYGIMPLSSNCDAVVKFDGNSFTVENASGGSIPADAVGISESGELVRFGTQAVGKTFKITGNTDYYTLDVVNGCEMTFILDDFKAEKETQSPLFVRPSASLTIILADDSDNSFKCSRQTVSTNVTAGIWVGNNENGVAELTITTAGQTQGNGRLYAEGSMGSAGIGGYNGFSSGIINIEGGNITARGANLQPISPVLQAGAGIGGGIGGTGGEITIMGGNIEAYGVTGHGSAGIGGGHGAAAGYVHITGGNIKAAGSPGIGSGAAVQNNNNDVNTIYIEELSRLELIAEGGGAASGIGSAAGGRAPDITIAGGTVRAISSSTGAGIGAPSGGSTGDIIIKGTADVTAIGGRNAATTGIGDAPDTFGATVTLEEKAMVRAYSSSTTYPAIYAAHIEGDAYYVNGHLADGALIEATPENMNETAIIELYEDGWESLASGTSLVPDRLELPSGYTCFAYTTGGEQTVTNLKVTVEGEPVKYFTYAEDYSPVGECGSPNITSVRNEHEDDQTLQKLKLTVLEVIVKKKVEPVSNQVQRFFYRVDYESRKKVVEKTWYLYIELEAGQDLAEVLMLGGLPGTYQVTEISSNWRYKQDTSASGQVQIQRYEDSEYNEGAAMHTFFYKNLLNRDEWISGNMLIENKMESIG